MMVDMEVVLVVLLVVLLVAAAAAITWLVAGRRVASPVAPPLVAEVPQHVIEQAVAAFTGALESTLFISNLLAFLRLEPLTPLLRDYLAAQRPPDHYRAAPHLGDDHPATQRPQDDRPTAALLPGEHLPAHPVPDVDLPARQPGEAPATLSRTTRLTLPGAA